MAVSDPLIFDSFSVGGTQYELMDTDDVNIDNEAEKLTVENAQEIIAGVESGMQIACYDLAVQNDSAVIMDSDVDPATDKNTISLNGSAGSSSVSIPNVYITGELKFDKTLPYVMLSVNVKASASEISIT